MLTINKSLMNVFNSSQFTYSPHLGMFLSGELNNKIGVDNSVSIHQRNIQSLAVELFKVSLFYLKHFATEIFQRIVLFNPSDPKQIFIISTIQKQLVTAFKH